MKKTLLLAVAVFALAFVAGVLAEKTFIFDFYGGGFILPEKDLHLGLNEFINPLLDCQSTDVTPPKEGEIKSEVEAFIAEAKKAGKVESVSVYYRDLFNGPSFGIETDVHFTPASLLKVPVMIGYYKAAEKNSQILEEKIVYDPKKYLAGGASQVVDVPPPLTPGQSYKVDFLINRMITLSDNASAKMLVEHMPELNIGKTLTDMGVQVHSEHGNTWIDVRSYASILRILYNSTYLGRLYSNTALAVLTKSDFHEGLVAGVDTGIPVAHKFGERTLDGIVQLHDCGIIYFPNRPYLMCVMTRGKSFKDLIPIVADISKIIFRHARTASH
jgi:beta-lactamase class A